MQNGRGQCSRAIRSGASPYPATGKLRVMQATPPVRMVLLLLCGLSLFGAFPAFDGRRLVVAGGD